MTNRRTFLKQASLASAPLFYPHIFGQQKETLLQTVELILRLSARVKWDVHTHIN